MKKIIVALGIITTSCSLTEPPDDFKSALSDEVIKAFDSVSPVTFIVHPVNGQVVPLNFTAIVEVVENDVVKEVKVKVDSNSWESAKKTHNTWQVKLSVNEGKHTITALAVDRAGNSNAVQVKITAVEGVFVSTWGNDSVEYPSAKTPFKSIQKAIDYAFSNGFSDVFVGEGTYGTETNCSYIVELKSGICLHGGYSSDFTAQTGISVIDGDMKAVHIIYGTGVKNLKIDKFKIVKGNATKGPAYSCGGGIMLVGVKNITLENLEVVNNQADYDGGGIYIEGENILITNSIVSNNTATADGGGIKISRTKQIKIADTLVAYNKALENGGGVAVDYSADVVLENISMLSNSASLKGGGFYTFESSNVCIAFSDFSMNSVSTPSPSAQGGAVYGMSLSYDTLIVSNCSFTSNTSYYDGGAILSSFNETAVLNSSFTANSSLHSSALTLIAQNCTAENCSFSNNSSSNSTIRVIGDNNVLKLLSLHCNKATNTIISIQGDTNSLISSYITTNSSSSIVKIAYSTYDEIKNTVMVSNSSGSGLILNHSTDVRTANLTISEVKNDGILLTNASSNSVIINCLIFNTGEYGIDEGDNSSDPLIISNCNIYNTFGGLALYYDEGSTDITTISDLNNLSNTYGGNISQNPAVDESMHLTSSSPCIDSGIDPSPWAVVSNDIDGDPRPNGSNYDIGADEYY